MPRTPAVLAQVLAAAFSDLRVSAALMDGENWYPIHVAANVIRFESAHGVELKRWAYNRRSIDKARRSGSPVLGQHAGLWDLFVPLGNAAGPPGILVVGPFAQSRVTSSEILARWRGITGMTGRISDPEYAYYASTTLATATFEGARYRTFERLVAHFARLLDGSGDAERLSREIESLRAKLDSTRAFERASEIVRELVDESTTRSAPAAPSADTLRGIGIHDSPQHVLVGLLLDQRRQAEGTDSLVRRSQFQRACLELCQKRSRVVSGCVGDYGVAFVSDDPGSEARVRSKLIELADQACALARRFELRLHVGVCGSTTAAGIPARYRAALAAAEKALSEGATIVHAERQRGPRADSLRELRRQLSALIREDPSLLRPHFDRYVDALTAHSGYRFEPIRAYLEGAFDIVVDALRDSAALDERTLAEFGAVLERAASEAATVHALTATYREVVADVERALRKPREARRERSLQRAITHIREHAAEPLSLAGVARIAGFAPTYFSKLFAESERTTFQAYLRGLRLERARYMLTATSFSVEQVARLSGFRNRNRFHAAFKGAHDLTPAQYRQRAS